MKNKINTIIGVCLLLMVSLACECEHSSESRTGNGILSTTAHIEDLKFGTNENAVPPADVFQPKDQIYGVFKIGGASSEYKIKYRLLVDDVKGAKPGFLVKEDEMPQMKGGSHWFSFSMDEGFPAGRYRVETVLLDEENGREIDRKEGFFTVAGDR